MIDIHGSSLDNYLDCSRRMLASSYPDLLRSAGYEVNVTKKWVTALVGSAIHAGAEHLNNKYIKDSVMPLPSTRESALQSAIEKFHELLKHDLEQHEVFYTKHFPDNDTITAHIENYLLVYHTDILSTFVPKYSEKSFKVPIKDKARFVSTIDSFAQDGTLRDLKTGKNITSASAQMGCYIYLLEQSGEVVTGVQLDYIVRPYNSMNNPPEHKPIKYDVDFCRSQALWATARLLNDIEEFQKTGNIDVFSANPRSAGCNQIMCPLWGTKSCKGWMK